MLLRSATAQVSSGIELLRVWAAFPSAAVARSRRAVLRVGYRSLPRGPGQGSDAGHTRAPGGTLS